MAVWLDGVPHEPANFPTGYWFAPTGSCWHRTIGHWGGDYSVLTRGLVPSVQFLVGEDEGQWAQFYPADMICYGAAGANEHKVHLEVSGMNDAPFTPWQDYACRVIENGLRFAFGWSHNFASEYAGRLWIDGGQDIPGAVNHVNVAYPPNPSYQHYDKWADAFAASLDAAPAPPISSEDDMRLFHDTATDLWWLATPNGMTIAPPEHVWNLSVAGVPHNDLPTSSVQWLGQTLHENPVVISGAGAACKFPGVLTIASTTAK